MDPIDQNVGPLFTGGNRILRARALHIAGLHANKAIPVDFGHHVHLGDLSQNNPISKHARDV